MDRQYTTNQGGAETGPAPQVRTATAQAGQLPPAIVVIPSNDEASSHSQNAMKLLRKEQDGFHTDFLGPWDHAYNIDGPCPPSIQRLVEDNPKKDVLYALRLDESCPEPSYDSLGTCRGWVLGGVGVDRLHEERRIHGVLGPFPIPKDDPTREGHCTEMMVLGFDGTSALPILCSSPQAHLEIFHDQEWHEIEGVPDGEEYIQRKREPTRKICKWFLHNKITKVRLFFELEYEIRIENRFPNEIVEQRDTYLVAGSNYKSVAPLLCSLIPPPGSKVRDFILLSSIRTELNLEASTAVNCRTGELVRVASFSIQTVNQRNDLIELDEFYTSRKAHPGFAHPLGTFCLHGMAGGCAQVNDKVHFIYEYGLCSFDKFDWKSTPRDTRLALIFGPLVGMSKANSVFRSLGQDALTMKNLVVLQLLPTPMAVVGTLQGAQRLWKHEARKAAGKELLAYMKTVAAIIQAEYGYNWEAGREVEGLKQHAVAHNEDVELIACMLLVLERESEMANGRDVKRNPRAGHLLSHRCWNGLGRWRGLRDRG